MIKTLISLWGKADASQTGGEGGSDVNPDTPRRKTVVPLWRRRSFIAITLFLGMSVLGGVSTWAVQTGWAMNALNHTKWALIKMAADQGFTVEDVMVTGRGETNRDDLVEALGVARGAPILAYDFEAAKARVESLPWVLHARIERLLPDTLAVHLIERRPIALWQNQGQFALIDEEGQVITREQLGRFAHLIHVVGEDAPNHVGGLLELLATQPTLKSQIKAAVRVGGRRWDLMLTGGVDVRLPEVGVPEALARLVDFEQETGALGREIVVLDLRAPDRIIVRRSTNAPQGDGAKTDKIKSGQET